MTTSLTDTNIRLRRKNQLFVDLPVSSSPEDSRFYVLLHGSISLVQGENDEFRAYAIGMGEDHRYRFGSWLAEDEMPTGFRAKLVGVERSKKNKGNSLNPKLNPTIKVKDWPADDDPSIEARIDLPRPRRIHYLGLGDAEIENGASLIFAKPKVSGLTVFEYVVRGSFEDLELRSLDGARLFWKCTAATAFPGCDARMASLHIFNAPPNNTAPVAHSLDEFAKTTRLLGQPQVRLVRKPKDLAAQPPVPDGLSPHEVKPLAERPRLLAKLAEFARTARFGSSHPLSDDGCQSCCSGADGDRG